VAGDIASPAGRGSYTGLVLCGYVLLHHRRKTDNLTSISSSNLAPLLGPVLGGVIVQHLGWRYIFWFLAILSGTCFILLALFFPETSRSIVGNGSIAAGGINKTLVSFIFARKPSNTAVQKRKIRLPNPLSSVYTVFRKDAGLIMLVHGTFYMAYGCIQASLFSLFIDIYHVGGVQAGLIYLPVGTGCILASYFTGMPPFQLTPN
jgi:MFS family permease